MEETEVVHSATGQLLQYGVLGIVVIVFAAVIVFLWRWAVAQQDKLFTKYEVVQAARLKDAADHQEKIDSLTKACAVEKDALYKERQRDIEASQEKFVDLLKQTTAALNNTAILLEGMKDTVSEAKNAMREIAEDLRIARRTDHGR